MFLSQLFEKWRLFSSADDRRMDMMQLYAVPQIEHLQPHTILEQDGAPPHWGLQVCACLDRTFPGTWIGRDGPMSGLHVHQT
jgi:hypothetical protein